MLAGIATLLGVKLFDSLVCPSLTHTFTYSHTQYVTQGRKIPGSRAVTNPIFSVTKNPFSFTVFLKITTIRGGHRISARERVRFFRNKNQ